MLALAKDPELKALLAEEFFQLVPAGHVDDIPEHRHSDPNLYIAWEYPCIIMNDLC